MAITEQQVRSVVERVVSRLLEDGEKPAGAAPAGEAGENGQHAAGDRAVVTGVAAGGGAPAAGGVLFTEMDRLIDAAGHAQAQLVSMTLEQRKRIIQSIRDVLIRNLDALCRMAVEETGLGNCRDKDAKNRLAALKTPGVEDIEPVAYTDDAGLTLVERAPYGVIGAVTPCTNPTETLICNSIGMVAGGNAVVFNPHPAAKETSRFTVSLFNQAVQDAGGPPELLAAMSEPTIQSAQAMMKHPGINLLVVTGGPGVVKEAMRSEKKVIAAGPGNPPVVVDETADIDQAGRDIVLGAGLDNNIVCICEKEILAVGSIADSLKESLKKHGAYELNSSQTDRITELVIQDPGRPGHEGAPNKKYVGKDAAVIAEAIGIQVSPQTRILLCEVDADHPLVWTEQLMPVIPLVRMNSADEAIAFAVRCEHGFRHTASIHSKNIDRLSHMAKVMNCSVFVKNGPNYAGLGYGGAGFPSYTIASPTGEGLTRARTFTRERRCTLVGSFRIV
ncbi:MAG: aldehyde dehydrogenase family protein [Spirochaetota bacterium]